MEINAELLDQLENLLIQQIPMAKALGFEITRFNDEGLLLSAPLRLNHNHQGTIFGGSISALATLAGWGMMYLITQEFTAKPQIIIHESHIRYEKPIVNDFYALCQIPRKDDIEKLSKGYFKKKLARLKLTVQVKDKQEGLALFTGTYVIYN